MSQSIAQRLQQAVRTLDLLERVIKGPADGAGSEIVLKPGLKVRSLARRVAELSFGIENAADADVKLVAPQDGETFAIRGLSTVAPLSAEVVGPNVRLAVDLSGCASDAELADLAGDVVALSLSVDASLQALSADKASVAYVNSAIQSLVSAAPGVLDTLQELATALGNDPNFAASMTAALAAKAPLASPAFTGTPTAPTAVAGTNTTQVATTAFVQSAVSPKANLASPTFTGTPAAPTAAAGTNTTQLATTAFVQAGLAGKANTSHPHAIADVTGLQGALDDKAPLASPTFTGTPAAPTAAAGTNTTQVATTAFVQAGLAGKANTSHPHAIADVTGLQGALDAKAPLASPALTGTPTAPTAAAGTSTTQLATTAFVQAAIAALLNAAPGVLDTLDELAAALGDDPNFAATMTTALAAKAPLASPAFTGTPTAPTAAGGTNTTQVATTAFVQAAVAPKANLASPTFTGTPAAPTAAGGTNTTQVATTAFVQAAVSPKADLASPTFTGTPAAPTAAPGTDTTQIATTAFVSAAVAAAGGFSPASQAEAEAGTDNAKGMTPLRTRQAQIAQSIADIAALQAIAQTALANGERRFVMSENVEYVYKAAATAGDYAPTGQVGGTGWWIRTGLKVGVLMGTFTSAITLPLPAGFTEAQCKFMWTSSGYVDSGYYQGQTYGGTSRNTSFVSWGPHARSGSYIVVGTRYVD